MSEERITILEMLENGKITTDEALTLLDAIDDSMADSTRLVEPPTRSAHPKLIQMTRWV
ncbi:hypothetical protein KFU94_41875 [Chloroflexi bacterium TSY]|nr:hypothetical protein [Chloroflexi bacterium TSY]